MNKLSKDVGRITFPNLEPKITRPDQEVATYGTDNQIALGARKAVQHLYNFFKGELPATFAPHFQSQFENVLSHPVGSKNAGYAIQATVGAKPGIHHPLGAFRYKGSEPFVKEHEGLHHLVNLVSVKHNIPADHIYAKLNQKIPDNVHMALSHALVSRGYTKDIQAHEYVPALRDMLVHPEWRQKVLETVSPEHHNAFTTAAKVAFRNIRDFAKNAAIGDLIQKSLEDADLPVKTHSQGVLMKSDKSKDEEKQLKKLLDSYIAVAAHKLGRPPALEDLTKMLSDEDMVDTKAEAVSVPVASQAPGNRVIDSLSNTEPKQAPQEVKKAEEPAGADQSLEPKILHFRVFYGMSGDDNERKPDPTNVLFYKHPDGRYYDCGSQSWTGVEPVMARHLPSREMQFNEKDIVAAIANGVMDGEDYSALEKAQMITPTCRRLWELNEKLASLKSQLDKSGDELSGMEDLEKSHDVLEDDDDVTEGEAPGINESETDDIVNVVNTLFLETGSQPTSEGAFPEEINPGSDLVKEIITTAISSAIMSPEMESRVREIIYSVMSEIANGD